MFCQKCGTKLPPSAQFCASCGAAANGEIANGKEMASGGRRLANYLIDLVTIYILQFVALLIVYKFVEKPIISGPNPTLSPALLIVYYGGFFFGFPLYYIFFESIWARTPGKWATKTKVVRIDGTKPRFWRVVGRSFARIIPFEPLSFLGRDASGWHDGLTGTIVVSSSYTVDDIKSIRPGTAKSNIMWIVIIPVVALFVIAIIGILSSVVLASLNTARIKGADAAIKSNLAVLRLQGELYFDSHQGYTGFCDTAAAKQYLEAALVSSAHVGGNYACNDGLNVWVASSPLRSAGYWCVDSNGASRQRIISLAQETSCGESAGTEQSVVYSGSNADNASFITYTSPTKDFSVLFPRVPKVTSTKAVPISGSNATYDQTLYSAGDGRRVFSLINIVYSNPFDISHADDVLNALVTGLTGDSQFTILASEYGYYGKHRVLDALVMTPDELMTLRYLIADDHTVYMLLIESPAKDVDGDINHSFLDSFKIL